MRIPIGIDLQLLETELRPICVQWLKTGTDDPRIQYLETIGTYLVFFLGQLSRTSGQYKDRYGWTRIYAEDLGRITPFYSVINKHLEAKGIVITAKGNVHEMTDKLIRRNGYRLKEAYEDSEMRIVNYDPEILRRLLLQSPYDHVDSTGRISTTVHQLKSFDDDEVERFLDRVWNPPVIEPTVYIDSETNTEELTPEELKGAFLESAEEIVECEAPYEWKKAYIRECAADWGVPLTETEIEALLEENEKERKARWEETLNRFKSNG